MRLTIAAALTLLLASPSSGAIAVSKPDLYEKSWQATAAALHQYGEWDEDAERRRVLDIGYRLVAESRFTEFPFSFFLVDLREPNAFALPGGQIFVTRGMLELGLSDDELAALLGHEIAHVTEHHGTRMQRRATLLNVLGSALIIGVALTADEGEPSNTPRNPYEPRQSRTGAMIQGAAAASLVVSELLLRGYSRDFEDESDEKGQRMAAAAGFDPEGTALLMETLREKLPQDMEYGYWRTHPFFVERVKAAEARGKYLKAQHSDDPSELRVETQTALLDFLEKHPPKEPDPPASDERPERPRTPAGEPPELPAIATTMKAAALATWPQGPTAERLREEALHALRRAEAAKDPLTRDYGRLLAAYAEHLDEVELLTPDSAFLARLQRERAAIETEAAAAYPPAAEVLAGGVVQTPFLEIFLSNWPDADEAPLVALQLATAYRRLDRGAEAVHHYLRAWRTDPEGEIGGKAIAGLRTLVPGLDRMAALEEVAREVPDDALETTARERLGELAGSFDGLDNGAEYLRRYPEGAHAGPIEARMNTLADALYTEVVLYQGVGDSLKALEKIQAILTHAPLSPAADRLRDRAVLEG